MSSKYKVCAKCGIRHSAVVPHKCFKVKKDKPPECEEVEHDLEKGGPTKSTGVGGNNPEEPPEGDEDKTDAEPEDGGADAEGDADDDGEGEDEDEGKGEGDSEGETKDGEAEAEAEVEGEGEGPAPQPPEPEAPPVVIVCTVLKFAALTAACAKNGSVEVSLTEDGLFVYGHNGDLTAFETMPWGDFEKRSTVDGEFYVKEVIDGVDAKLAEPSDDAEALKRLIAEAKKAPKADKPKGGQAKKPAAKKR